MTKLIIDAFIAGTLGYWLHKLMNINYRKRWLEARDLAPQRRSILLSAFDRSTLNMIAIGMAVVIGFLLFFGGLGLVIGLGKSNDSCGPSGIQRIYPGNGSNQNTYTVVCKNGYIYDH